ncbi:MAG: PfkB family carbohydrate kinase [Myxococcota bacterium]|nr:PfkB family carbohydrate kinase [Myxococcota bacterium]
MSLLVVGSMALDDLELPSGSFRDVLGGSATHLAFVASALTQCRVVAVVGDDFPTAVLEALAARGVDVRGVRREPGRTFRWAGRYLPGFAGRETIGTWLGVFERFDPAIPEASRDSETVFLGNIAPSLQARVLDQVRRPRFTAIDTMNFWIRGARADLDALVGRVDAVFVNDEELLEWTGAPGILDGIDALHSMGPRVIVVKRGEHGAYMSDRGDLAFSPAVPVRRVIDPTGAGDAFAGGFMGHVDRAGTCDRATLREALRTAASAGSFAVEGVGADALAAVTPERIEERRAILAALVG